MKKAIIMPTINVPTVLTEWVKGMTPEQDLIIVAGGGAPGDDKPHDEIYALCENIRKSTGVYTRYIPPIEQRHWRCSESMGWYSTTRRNIALLEVLMEAPDTELIITLDDDNAPTVENQATEYEQFFADDFQVEGIQAHSGWVNPCTPCNARNGWGEVYDVIHRGFPLSQRFKYHNDSLGIIGVEEQTDDFPIGVFASLWTGAPDIDAIDRITANPTVDSIQSDRSKLMPGTWAPFDSQATVYRTQLAPLMMCWPWVGRYDDIWASYLARSVMDRFNYTVMYGMPAVHQDRNEHDLFKDLEVEMFGMRHTDAVVDVLRNVNYEDDTSVYDAMRRGYAAISDLSFIPDDLRRAFDEWSTDIANVTMQ